MPRDFFLKLERIEGESDDLMYPLWIEILSFSWGMRQRAGEGLGSTGRTDFDSLTITKNVDKTSPQLAEACCTRTRPQRARLVLCRATGNKAMYYEIKLEKVVVASVKMEAQGGPGLPVETVQLNFDEIEWTYYGTDHKTGRPLGQVSARFSLRANK